MSMTARELALDALTAFRKRGARPDIILSNAAVKSGMDKRDVALASNIMNGVLQNEAYCDYYISLYSGRELSYFEPAVLDILRLSVYQLFFLTKVPAHAVVSEGVALSKKHSRGASGLVNAVLRKIAREKDNIPEIKADSQSERLSIKYSHPKWLVDTLIDDYGEETAEKILTADNTPSPVTLITNTLKKTPDSLRAELTAEGASIEEHPVLSEAFYISSSGAVNSFEAFKSGDFYVQDAAAYMAVLAAEPKRGYKVLDTCSAPGGKSFACAIMMENEGEILSCDIHEKKLNLVKSGAERLGISIIKTEAHDGKEPFEGLENACDLVITDVPCSGIGVIRSKPDIRYKEQEPLNNLPSVQLGIVSNAAGCVKPGGTLVYSTCTILRRENEGVVEEFLKSNPDFELCEFTLPEPFGRFDGMATILPHICNTDGFFICKMRRKK